MPILKVLSSPAIFILFFSISLSLIGFYSSGCGTEASCGDGKVQSGEDCDDGGESKDCNADCTLSKCGDGIFNSSDGEDCDDGEVTDSCSATCKSLSCTTRPDFSDKVGGACSSATECPGPGTATCLTEYKPVEPLIFEDADPALADTYRDIGLLFEGGYCSTEGNCAEDSDCGEGGACFWPLEDVEQETLDSMASMDLPFDINGFKQASLCLAPCETDCDCREGYICGLPIGDLIGLVPGSSKETFCIQPSEE